MLYLRCLQAFSDNLQSCHFPVYHSINSYIFLSKFSNFLVIISLENRLSKNLIIRLFLILFSIILSYYASFAILFISSFASINPRCVYTFNVTPISECPIKYWSAFGFIPAFAILEQYVCLHTCGRVKYGTKKIFLFSCRIVPDHSNQVLQHFYYLPQNRSCPEHFISALKIHHHNSIQFRFPPGYAPG